MPSQVPYIEPFKLEIKDEEIEIEDIFFKDDVDIDIKPIPIKEKIYTYGKDKFDDDFEFNEIVPFERNSTKYDVPLTDKILSDLVKTLKEYPELILIIEGNVQLPGIPTPTRNPNQINAIRNAIFNNSPRLLTNGQWMLQRALAIHAYLIKKGVSNKIITRTGTIYPDPKRGKSTSFIIQVP